LLTAAVSARKMPDARTTTAEISRGIAGLLEGPPNLGTAASESELRVLSIARNRSGRNSGIIFV